MPVETTLSRVQYDTNGTTGPWSIPFYFLEDADILAVYADSTGAETNLVLTTDYSLAGAGDESGGTMTTVSAYAAGGTLTILRDVDALQTTEFQDGDNFPASAVNRGLDRLTMIVQQLKEKVGRALLFPVSDDTSGALPSATDRANTQITFDSSGALNFDAPASGSAADVLVRLASSAVGWGSKLVAYILRATGSVARWVEDKLAERISLLDFGGVGDGVSDNSTAIANWKAALSKGVITGETRRDRGYVPAGVYAYSTPIVFDGDDGWDIVGDGELNSVLYCTATTGDAVTFETNVFNFEGIGIYASPARQAGSGDGLVIDAGLTTTSARGTVRNVHVLNQPGLGVKGFRIEHHNFDKVWASFCGSGGFLLDSVTSSAAWNTFTNCRSYGCVGKPWELTALTSNNVLENCEALQWTGADEGFVIDGRSNFLINPDAENQDNVTGATSYKGVVLSGSRHRLLGGYIGGMNTGISLESAALCKIEQPLITNAGTAVTGTNAIVEDSSSFWNDIEITNVFTQFTNVLSPATGRAGDRVRIGTYVVSPPTAERFVAASTSSGTYTPDLTQYTSFVLTLGANTTIEFPTGLVSGMSLKFTFVQGGAGGYTVTFNGAYLHNWSNTGNTVGKWSSIGFFIESGSVIRQSGAQSAYI